MGMEKWQEKAAVCFALTPDIFFKRRGHSVETIRKCSRKFDEIHDKMKIREDDVVLNMAARQEEQILQNEAQILQSARTPQSDRASFSLCSQGRGWGRGGEEDRSQSKRDTDKA